MPNQSHTNHLVAARDDADTVRQTGLDIWNDLHEDATLTASEMLQSIDAARAALSRLRRRYSRSAG